MVTPQGEGVKHESYGLMSINRTTNAGGKNLFGSSIKHHSTISIVIKQAEMTEELNKK